MSVLDNDAKQFYSDLQESYISKLQSEGGVETAAEYFELAGGFANQIEQSPELRSNLGDVILESFFRVAPAVGQDVMITTLNPGMQNTISASTFEDGGEYGRHNRAGTDVSKTASAVARHLNGFLTSSDNRFDDLIECLRDELDFLDDKPDYEDYVEPPEDDLLDGLFGEICYTWTYKFATNDKGRIPELGSPGRSFAREQFVREVLDIVQPKVLVCVGKEGWKAIYDHVAEQGDPMELIEAYSEKSPVTSSYHSKLEKGAYSGLYRIPSEDLWVVTTWHASYWVKTQRLRENLQTLNQELD
ncbi:hypothetical protein [Halobacterium sp. R2-5]|uniref:hypothetical protein n=1 Tax=Halobacterium sp. R2-5 TaxID=2715751 RepID=UPI00141F04A0|nr:hypothetical protein [Halobacterium sp. R2-5]NIC00917.1 hypothetical protein [Halobacterium sp. R2-5]